MELEFDSSESYFVPSWNRSSFIKITTKRVYENILYSNTPIPSVTYLHGTVTTLWLDGDGVLNKQTEGEFIQN